MVMVMVMETGRMGRGEEFVATKFQVNYLPKEKHWEFVPKGAKVIRFTDDNWQCFFTKGKKTTWRTTKRKDGIYLRVKGSLFNPKPTSEKVEIKYLFSKMFSELTAEDAINDGFDNLEQFKTELIELNENKINNGKPMGMLHCHSARVISAEQRLFPSE
jgi:hypothetical protein